MNRAIITSSVVLVALCAAPGRIHAAYFDHWNPTTPKADIGALWAPGPNPGYPVYEYQNRTPDEIEEKLKYQGRSYAGRGEFPFLVDIRSKFDNEWEAQDKWANGNLINHERVLTVCSMTVDVHTMIRDPKDDVFWRANLTWFTARNPKLWQVLFSDDYPYKPVGNGYYTGTREIRRFVPHPKCYGVHFDYQWGIVELARPIWPQPPWTAYMPVNFVRTQRGIFADYKKQYLEADPKERVSRCTIGLWGRYLKDNLNPDLEGRDAYAPTSVLDFKIKYNIISVDPRECWLAVPYFSDFYRGGPLIHNRECMALHPNETIGAICDRDRGAPILCDQQYVVGMLLAGVEEDYCNQTRPFPFLVMDIKYALTMFTEINSYQLAQENLKLFGRVDRNT